MCGLHPDIALVACTAKAYGRLDAACTLHMIAQIHPGTRTPTPWEVLWDMCCLADLQCFHVESMGHRVPDIVAESARKGHAVFAQMLQDEEHPRQWWGLLAGEEDGEWTIVSLVPDGDGSGTSVEGVGRSTGQYIVCRDVLVPSDDDPDDRAMQIAF